MWYVECIDYAFIVTKIFPTMFSPTLFPSLYAVMNLRVVMTVELYLELIANNSQGRSHLLEVKIKIKFFLRQMILEIGTTLLVLG